MSTGYPLPDSNEPTGNDPQAPATPNPSEPTDATPSTNDSPESTGDNTPAATESAPVVVQDSSQPVAPQPMNAPVAPATPPVVPTPAPESTTAPVVPAPAPVEAAVPPTAPAPSTPTETAAPADSGAKDIMAAAESAQAADEAKERPRVRLNPTANDARSLGSVDMVEKPLDPETGKPIPVPEASGPVEIPREAEIDASLEAELNAAIQGGATEVEPATQAVDTLAEAPADPEVAATAETPPPVTEETLEPGMKLKGTVQQIHGDNCFVDVGLRSAAVVPMRQFESAKKPEVGKPLEVLVVNVKSAEGLIECSIPRGKQKVAGNWSAVAKGQVVDCMVKKTNKGGLEVTVSNLRGFLPSSQIELGYASDLESYVGQKLTVQITEVNPRKRNLVVSRKALLLAERKEKEAEFWKELAVGQIFKGTVKTLKDYGAFVDLGAVDGFLHIGEMSWSRVNHPNEILKTGQEIDVKVLTKDEEKRRIGLGMRQLTTDPWATAADKYLQGTTVTGTVTRTADFGAFVRLEQGVEGLVHISQVAWRRIGRVTEVLNVGDSREFQVLEVDSGRKRISLSLKALEAKPEGAKPDPEPEAAPVRKKREGPLKGGREGVEGKNMGGLFGNPTDFS